VQPKSRRRRPKPAEPKFVPVDLSARLKEPFRQKVDNFMVILDASGSMGGETKYPQHNKRTFAQALISRMNQTIPQIDLNSALRSLGHGICMDNAATLLIQKFQKHQAATLEASSAKVECAGGHSSLGKALKAARTDLEPLSGNTALIIFSDGKDMADEVLVDAKLLVEKYGERLCITTVLIGKDNEGAILLRKVANLSACGSPVKGYDIYSPQGMANFVEKVFFRKMLDQDGDGVYDDMDKCPNTLKGAPVDQAGCRYDVDGDRVYDDMDKCPNTPKGALVDQAGCRYDADGDGVPDDMDKCPNTPKGAPVDQAGCRLDADGDRVYDDIDKCPNTPKGAPVGQTGCRLDTDGDRVYDDRDNCPNTPKGALVDQAGCRYDTDGDRVYDDMDKCPNTPMGAPVDQTGCRLDADGDGVYDDMDKCPNTPKGVPVDKTGCLLDADRDGVHDYDDDCPNTPFSASVNAGGCWNLKNILFDVARWNIKPQMAAILDQVVSVFKANPALTGELYGHTDNVGSKKSNQALSEKRVDSVKAYMVGKGISADRFTTKGLSFVKPASSNETDAGRAKNRRVELLLK
jgi:hypothetical protein